MGSLTPAEVTTLRTRRRARICSEHSPTPSHLGSTPLPCDMWSATASSPWDVLKEQRGVCNGEESAKGSLGFARVGVSTSQSSVLRARPAQRHLCSVCSDLGWRGWAQGQLEAAPGARRLLRCGEGIKEFPDISVADRNHTENLCQGELLDFIKYEQPLFIPLQSSCQAQSENIRNYQ